MTNAFNDGRHRDQADRRTGSPRRVPTSSPPPTVDQFGRQCGTSNFSAGRCPVKAVGRRSNTAKRRLYPKRRSCFGDPPGAPAHRHIPLPKNCRSNGRRRTRWSKRRRYDRKTHVPYDLTETRSPTATMSSSTGGHTFKGERGGPERPNALLYRRAGDWAVTKADAHRQRTARWRSSPPGSFDEKLGSSQEEVTIAADASQCGRLGRVIMLVLGSFPGAPGTVPRRGPSYAPKTPKIEKLWGRRRFTEGTRGRAGTGAYTSPTSATAHEVRPKDRKGPGRSPRPQRAHPTGTEVRPKGAAHPACEGANNRGGGRRISITEEGRRL